MTDTPPSRTRGRLLGDPPRTPGCDPHFTATGQRLHAAPDAPRTGGRLRVDQLRIQGCDRIFTVPGESFLAVLDALHDTPEIDVVVCRPEGGGGDKGEGDGKLTNRPGVAFV